jgi:hypothetical protein
VVRILGDLGTSSVWLSRVVHQVESSLLVESDAYDKLGGRTLTWDELLDTIVSMPSLGINQWSHRAAAAEAKLAQVSNRRALRLADSLGSLARARSWSQAREAIEGVRRSGQ